MAAEVNYGIPLIIVAVSQSTCTDRHEEWNFMRRNHKRYCSAEISQLARVWQQCTIRIDVKLVLPRSESLHKFQSRPTYGTVRLQGWRVHYTHSVADDRARSLALKCFFKIFVFNTMDFSLFSLVWIYVCYVQINTIYLLTYLLGREHHVVSYSALILSPKVRGELIRHDLDRL